MENLTIRKSDLNSLAIWAKGSIEEETISATVGIVLILGNIEINLSKEFKNANVLSIMSYFRKKVSNIIFLKGMKMYLKISINGEIVDNGLFSSKLVYSGKKEARYLVFNQFFIITMSNYLGIECLPTDDNV